MKFLIKYLFFLLFFLSGWNLIAQNSHNKYPLLFGEFFLGGYQGHSSGFMSGVEINYQGKKNLLSLRYTTLNDIAVGYGLVPIPISTTNAKFNEIAALYGLRFIDRGHSISFSTGPSYNLYAFNNIDGSEKRRIHSLGLALETNVKWFKKEKKTPFRV